MCIRDSIQVPDYELRMAIINKKAESLGLILPPEVVEFLANKIKNNVRQIEGALKKVLAFNLINQTTPSIAVAQSAVADILNTNEPVVLVVDRIITEVARYYGISADDIKSKKRTSNITMARQVSMYIIREVCQLSLPLIGEDVYKRQASARRLQSVFRPGAARPCRSFYRRRLCCIRHRYSRIRGSVSKSAWIRAAIRAAASRPWAPQTRSARIRTDRPRPAATAREATGVRFPALS